MVVGSPGGSNNTSVLQTILNVYEHDLSMQAVNASRFSSVAS
jgi:gamma-glutamyltranspeptidase/glutathione hydrolase